MCRHLVNWYDAHKQSGTKPRPQQLDGVYRVLGGKFGKGSAICWSDSDRDGCQRFERIERRLESA